MKTLLNKLLKGRITRWGFLAVLLLAVGAFFVGMSPRHGKLGGAWLGGVLGIKWTVIHTPLDPIGRTATLQIQFPTWPAEMQTELLDKYGAQTLSSGVGEMAMRDSNTAKFTWVAYAVTDEHPAVIKAIWVVTGTWDFTGVDMAMSRETLNIYPADVPLCPNGLPDPKVKECAPLETIKFPPGLSVRVPILQ